MPVPEHLISRDNNNAKTAQRRAHDKLRQSHPHIFVDDITGSFSAANKTLIAQFTADQKSLVAIRENPFHVMVEATVVVRGGRSRKTLWYAHENTKTMQMLGDVVVLPWTHPGIQKALVEDLDEEQEIDDPRYTIVEITPHIRAHFEQLSPNIVGIYDPFGRFGQQLETKPQTGLKAVKLRMTRDQVRAFVHKMKGVLFVTGAPGSGKTTVAFQRIRFLFDAGENQIEVEHSPRTSRVFLANQNLIDHSKNLLEKQLDIPSSIVSLVKDFVEEYLEDAWRYKHDALFLYHDIKNTIFRRAREAFFSTCTVDDLKGCWKSYEVQIVERLLELESADWSQTKFQNRSKSTALQDLVHKLAEFAEKQHKKLPSTDPLSSAVTMGRLYRHCAREYERLREEMGKNETDKFDGQFTKWLFYVYDPLEALGCYFSAKQHEGALRIRKGTGGRVSEEQVIEQILSDFENRQYRREEIAWIVWLLRFSLPAEDDPKNRFRELPNALSPITGKYGPWSHVVIDEAQDLSVVEASVISSFVLKNGALTISADFKQVVSPVHGMENPNAFKIGCNLLGGHEDFQRFPFTKNMRQTAQITNFLMGFYQNAFKEMPEFIANEGRSGPKPQLRLMPYVNFSSTIRNALNTFKQSKFSGTMALLQINEDEEEMVRYRGMLEKDNVPLAPIWSCDNSEGGLITTSVERIKGLEFDVCFVIGIEKSENATINFNRNRVYVALSRPTQRLYMLCEHFPMLLTHVNHDLFDVFDTR